VGTETLVDKSKSTKTILMDILGANSNVEGATCLNACYGGTAALLNSVAWVESAAWDGRYAIVLAADIAIYEEGPARPTGGCGAVAMLIGPDAPLPLSNIRHTHAEHVWDFCKPNMESEYPAVDGPLSNSAYLHAVDQCYNNFMNRAAPDGDTDTFEYLLFHSPYNKLVQKSVGRLLYNDFVRAPSSCRVDLQEALQPWHPDQVDPKSTYNDRDLDKALKKASEKVYATKCKPGASLSQQVGNSYTAALYINLLSLVAQQGNALVDKKLFMFSYGSGLIATAFALLPRMPTDVESPFTCANIAKAVGLESRLQSRQEHNPSEFKEALLLREKAHSFSSSSELFIPTDPISTVWPNSYYLQEIQPNYHRIYAKAGQ